MRRQFREWYAPTENELRALWQQGRIILDSNVLLGLYQYPPATLAEFLKVLERVKERLWLPYQAGIEYHRNRDKSLPQQRGVLERLIKTIDELAAQLDRLGLPEYHPVLNLGSVEAARLAVREAFDSLVQPIRIALTETPEFTAESLLQGESVRDRLTELFDGRVGAPFTQEDLQRTYKEGDERYSREVPPGYKDRTKEEPGRYADLVIWYEILKSQAAMPEGSRAAIFVTNDRKDDWWLRKEDLLLGPRPELVREYLNIVGADFFMYTPADFLRSASQYLPVEVSPQAIEDVGRISTASPVTAFLRYQRMILPDPSTRVRGLAQIYDALVSGGIQRAGDLNAVIEALGEPFSSNYVEVPLFFSLVNQSYGPIAVEQDPSLRLRDRRVSLRETAVTKESFIRSAQVAWLAQALFRVRLESFTDEDLLVAFFGETYADEAVGVLRQARELAALDAAYRGRAV